MKRKIWSFMLATLLLVASVVNVGAVDDDNPYSDFQYITVFPCNVRTADSESASILTTLPKGHIAYSDHSSSAYIYGTNKWVDLTVSNGWGWVRADLVCPANRCYEVSTQVGVRLRAQANTTSDILCVLPYGTWVEKISVSGDFFYVRVRTTDEEPREGFVHSSYLTRP